VVQGDGLGTYPSGIYPLAKKLHPDVGGTQEQILTLQETKDHLERILDGKATHETYTYQKAREEPRTEYRTRWRTPPRDDFTGDVPLEPYPDDRDYVQLRDVVITGVTDKAFKIKIFGVKQQQWLPKSQMLFEEIPEPAEGDTATIVFTKWIAKQKGWIK
jgi:hypothetical protein